MVPTLGGGTQDTDFNKGFTKGIFTKNLRRRNGGGQGDPDGPYVSTMFRNQLSGRLEKENGQGTVLGGRGGREIQRKIKKYRKKIRKHT